MLYNISLVLFIIGAAFIVVGTVMGLYYTIKDVIKDLLKQFKKYS